MPASIVLLLKEKHLFEKGEIQRAAEKGWRRRFDGEENPMFFVVQNGGVTFLKAGPYVVNILHIACRYFEGQEIDIGSWLPSAEQKRAFLEHTAWVAIDFSNRARSDKEAHAVLARLAEQLADANCSAIYVPKKRLFIPNDGNAQKALNRLIEAYRIEVQPL